MGRSPKFAKSARVTVFAGWSDGQPNPRYFSKSAGLRICIKDCNHVASDGGRGSSMAKELGVEQDGQKEGVFFERGWCLPATAAMILSSGCPNDRVATKYGSFESPWTGPSS